MAHSIELLPDDSIDARIRAEWQALADAGLPSAARIRASSNRPHVTLIAAGHIDGGVDATLADCAGDLPLPCRIGAPLLFGHGSRRILARLVVPSAALLSVHARVFETATPFLGDAGAFAHAAPDSWTPHITLARRVETAQVAAVLEVLDALGPFDAAGSFTALRRWDPDNRLEHIVAGSAG
ncbi:2'-5' RNA ligase family protein [Gordonia sp. HNM0687]|uniref:2'-5' RNA ligase family protein n=1 Tax=Gordonia mangrovi TaxID=2665643 RepID=A0A6L7GNQ5_9ACTN|nr:2'-5' RNA ligase family protein [Gordonia mangrovi]MXP21242.1 2'-5' RNA ligase family protein [Gordonia mangrovi]UVF78231.1 2'-5' RNA ligase family protein [Gordonia mangrovi]